jgi:hypothetical protein
MPYIFFKSLFLLLLLLKFMWWLYINDYKKNNKLNNNKKYLNIMCSKASAALKRSAFSTLNNF